MTKSGTHQYYEDYIEPMRLYFKQFHYYFFWVLEIIIQNECILYTIVAVEIRKSCFEIYSSFPRRTLSYFKLILLPLSVYLCIFMGFCSSRAVPSPFTATLLLTKLIMLYAQLSPAANKTEPGILFFYLMWFHANC